MRTARSTQTIVDRFLRAVAAQDRPLDDDDVGPGHESPRLPTRAERRRERREERRDDG